MLKFEKNATGFLLFQLLIKSNENGPLWKIECGCAGGMGLIVILNNPQQRIEQIQNY